VKFKPTPTSLLTALAFAWLTGLTWLQLRQHPTPAVDVHYTSTQPAPLRGGRPVMGTTVNGSIVGAVTTNLTAAPGGTASAGIPYATVQSDGSTYLGTRGPLLGGAGNLVLGGSGATGPQTISIDYSGTKYRLAAQNAGATFFGDGPSALGVEVVGTTMDLWAGTGVMSFDTTSGGTSVGKIYQSGGFFWGATASDPGANNLTVQGITYGKGGNREAWRGIADVNFVGTTSDHWIAYTSISTARTGTIPCTVGAGTRFTIVDASGSSSVTNTITISASSGALNGGTNVINSAYGGKDYVSDGTNCVNVSGLL